MEPKANSGVEFNSGSREVSPPAEQSPEVNHASPEQYAERHERAEPMPQQPPQAMTPSQVVSLPTPVPVVDDTAAASSNDDNPSTAADEDLIEKEWVDKAKKIIEETRDDPHKRELEINKLQSDYLKKRYGKDLGDAA